MILFVLPIRTRNVLNEKMHWAKRARMVKEQRNMALFYARLVSPPIWRKGEKMPTILLTRLAPRRMDIHDGVPASLKPVVDGIADALGIDDQHLTIRYAQEKSKTYGVRVEVLDA